MAYNKEPLKNIAGDVMLPPTIMDQVKVSETDNTTLTEFLESKSNNDHDHDDRYYGKAISDTRYSKQSDLDPIKTDMETLKKTVNKFDSSIGNNHNDIVNIKNKGVAMNTLRYNQETQNIEYRSIDGEELGFVNVPGGVSKKELDKFSDRITALEDRITYSTIDIQEGDPLEPGQIYMVYEEK